MITRRDFIAGIGAAAWPIATHAQQSVKLPRIGFLSFGPAAAFAFGVEALRAGLRDLGYVEGKSIAMEFRWAERVDRLPELAAELAQMNVDVLFVPSSIEVEAARHATKTIPIVFAVHADPVGIGHVASLARPGGNITGLTIVQTDLVAKELELLKEVVPQATRIGILWNPTTPSNAPVLKAIEPVGKELGVQLLMVPARTAEDVAEMFSTMTRERVDAFVAVGSALFVAQRVLLAELALKDRLPGMFSQREFVEAGGLMSYGPDLKDQVRRAAVYIDKILKGTKAADLPVEQPTKFELVINLKTAKAFNLTMPRLILARADQVIE